jgi:hypothetical protein
LTLVSNLVKDSLIYAFQEALKPSVEKLVSGPVFQSILAEELLAVEWNFVYIKDALDYCLRPQSFQMKQIPRIIHAVIECACADE